MFKRVYFIKFQWIVTSNGYGRNEATVHIAFYEYDAKCDKSG